MTDKIEPTTRRDAIIDAIWHCLPATTLKGLARKVSRHLGERISKGVVDNAIVYLRRHPEQYGWTIPHVRRGQPRPTRKVHMADGREVLVKGDEDRFNAVLWDDKDTIFNEDHKRHIDAGIVSTLREVHRKSANESKALEAVSRTAPSMPVRRRMAEIAADFVKIEKKADALIREMQRAA
jgi:hypothetical protein